MSHCLEAQQVSLRLDGRLVLEQVSLTLIAGERVALLGPNGAGKSTLLDILCGVRKPDQGSVVLDGVDMRGLTRRQVAQQIALVPQFENMPEDLRVLDAVLMGRAPHQHGFALASDDDIEQARAALLELDLAHMDGREIGTLSGGERQRVLIARALVQEPKILLLDEPTSSLDLGHALYILHLVQRLAAKGVAVLASVHDLNQAPLFAQRVLILHRGRIVVDDSVDKALDPEVLRSWFEIDLLRGYIGGRPVLVPALQ